MAPRTYDPWAALGLTTTYSLLLSGPFDWGLLAAFTVVRKWRALTGSMAPRFARTAAKVAARLFVLAFLFSILRQSRRKRTTIAKDAPPRWDGPGHVLLFPCRTSHERRFPTSHAFSYSYLVVGVPVGFEGDAGGMVSVRAGGKPSPPPWLSLASRLPTAWFTIDAGDYLARGRPELGLRGKLDEYLQTQGADPATYPHAYLVTAARFLGYHFNPVSFWYLYDCEGRLSAMILEVNNTFGERRMYFLRSNSDPTGRVVCLAGLGYDWEAERSGVSSGDGCRETVFKRAWPKDFHVSPFNPRSGWYTVEASDPLSPCMQDRGPISCTIGLFSAEGRCKSVATLVSEGAAIDPYSLTAYQRLKFLASWGWVGLLTSPRTLKEAFRLYFRHRLHVWVRPEPLRDTLSRRANSIERGLEPIFRRYLRHLVEQSPTALAVKYTASGIEVSDTERMLSRAAREGAGTAEELEFRVLTPVFYARFVSYVRDLEGFVCELNEGRTIWVSRPDLLPRLAALQRPSRALGSSVAQDSASFKLIQKLRVRLPEHNEHPLSETAKSKAMPLTADVRESRLSRMDEYVLAFESAPARRTYRSCVLKLFLADRIAFGSVGLLDAQRFLLRVCLAWFASSFMTETAEALSMFGWKHLIVGVSAG